MELPHPAFLLYLDDFTSLWRSQKSSSMAQVLPPEQCSQNFILHTHMHECPLLFHRHHTVPTCTAQPWASVGWEQIMSAGDLGYSPLHPVSSGRISSLQTGRGHGGGM